MSLWEIRSMKLVIEIWNLESNTFTAGVSVCVMYIVITVLMKHLLDETLAKFENTTKWKQSAAVQL